MSGGHFDYLDMQMREAADEVDRLIATNDVEDTYGYANRYSEHTLAKFRHAAHFLRMAAIYLNRVDYLVCDDDGEEAFHKRLEEEVWELVNETMPRIDLEYVSSEEGTS